MHYVQKNNLFLARLPGISANSNEIYRHYNLQAFANISRNIKFCTAFLTETTDECNSLDNSKLLLAR